MTVVIVKDGLTKDVAIGIVKRADTKAPWRFEFIPWKKKRSDQQNRLYWKWVDEIRLHVLDSTGVIATKDDVHAELGRRLLPTYVGTNLDGDAVERTLSTTKMTVAEFRDHLDLVEMHCAADLGLVLSHPEDLYYESMGQGR